MRPGDGVHSMVTIVNSTVLYCILDSREKVSLESSHPKEKELLLCEVIDDN